MKKSGQVRGFLAGVMVALLVFSLATPTLAALAGKTIEVLTGVTIYVNGVEMKPTDANGKPVETFVYNGTTYVPLRAVSQSLGENVQYDGATQSVYIGERPGEKQYLLDVCSPYQEQGFRHETTYSIMGEKYANGFTLGSDGYALFNLNGRYSTLEFDIGHIDGEGMRDDGNVSIYLDGKLAFNMDLTGEMLPKHCVVPLYGALQMKVADTGWLRFWALTNVEIY